MLSYAFFLACYPEQSKSFRDNCDIKIEGIYIFFCFISIITDVNQSMCILGWYTARQFYEITLPMLLFCFISAGGQMKYHIAWFE